MQTILLLMKRQVIAQGIMLKLQGDPDFRLLYEASYACAETSINSQGVRIALIEVAESGPYDISYCLSLCGRLRERSPHCKLLLMCSEQDKGSINQSIQAKRKGKIDDFVFYDTSMDYLVSKFSSL